MSCSTRIWVSSSPREREQRLDEPLLLPAAQPGGRLVEQEDAGSLRERARHGEQPELAQGQRTGHDVRPAGEADELERLECGLLDPPLLAALPGHAKHRFDEPCARPRMAADHRVAEDVEIARAASSSGTPRRAPPPFGGGPSSP